MTDHDFFLTHIQYVNNYSFLDFSFDRIEQDFMEYFEYVPLEEKHLQVSSMRLSDLILRVFPLLGIAFRTITFGTPMKAFLNRLENQDQSQIDTVVKKLSTLHEKYQNNKDGLWDYHRLLNHKTTNSFIGKGILADTHVALRPRVGLVHMMKTIQPFKNSKWEQIIENRNAIEHRGKISTTMEEAIETLACLAILLETNAKNQIDYPLKFNSKIYNITSFFPDDWQTLPF